MEAVIFQEIIWEKANTMDSFQHASDGPFHASSLAKWFHSAPHKDLQLGDTTTIFTPSDESYRESLYVLAIFISSFGALLFLLFAIYYTCCYCICCKKGRRQHESQSCCTKPCLQLQVFLLALICCGALITGFIFNGKTSDGVDQFRNSVDDIQNDINSISQTGKEMRGDLGKAKDNIQKLSEMSQLPVAEEAYEESIKMIGSLDAVNGLLPQQVVNESSDVGDKVHRYDNYRWLATIILLSCCILMCIFLFWIGCKVNGCILFTATILSLLAVLFTWAFVGVDFAIATGIGDFCVHPKQAIEKIKKGNATSIVISYYMDCDGTEYNPFYENLVELQGSINMVINLIEQIPDYEPLKSQILEGLDRVNHRLPIYKESFTCDEVHKEYMEAMDGLCENTLNNLSIVMLAVLVIAFLSGLLTCCICPLWNYRHARPTIYNDIRNAPGDVGNSVLWWPHDVDADSERSFYQRHGEPTERSPLIANPVNQPNRNYESGYQPNLNVIHVNYHHNVGGDRNSANRHSF